MAPASRSSLRSSGCCSAYCRASDRPHAAATRRRACLKVRITTAAVTALLFGLLAWRFGFSPELPAFLLLALLGVQLSRIDFTVHLLPNALVLLLFGGGGLVLLLASAALTPGWADLIRALAGGGAILFAGYLILGLISPGSLGMGDVKLAAPWGCTWGTWVGAKYSSGGFWDSWWAGCSRS